MLNNDCTSKQMIASVVKRDIKKEIATREILHHTVILYIYKREYIVGLTY
jgi:hypothetical protein